MKLNQGTLGKLRASGKYMQIPMPSHDLKTPLESISGAEAACFMDDE